MIAVSGPAAMFVLAAPLTMHHRCDSDNPHVHAKWNKTVGTPDPPLETAVSVPGGLRAGSYSRLSTSVWNLLAEKDTAVSSTRLPVLSTSRARDVYGLP